MLENTTADKTVSQNSDFRLVKWAERFEKSRTLMALAACIPDVNFNPIYFVGYRIQSTRGIKTGSLLTDSDYEFFYDLIDQPSNRIHLLELTSHEGWVAGVELIPFICEDERENSDHIPEVFEPRLQENAANWELEKDEHFS